MRPSAATSSAFHETATTVATAAMNAGRRERARAPAGSRRGRWRRAGSRSAPATPAPTAASAACVVPNRRRSQKPAAKTPAEARCAEHQAQLGVDPAAVHGQHEEEDDPEHRHDPSGGREAERAESFEKSSSRRGRAGRGGRGGVGRSTRGTEGCGCPQAGGRIAGSRTGVGGAARSASPTAPGAANMRRAGRPPRLRGPRAAARGPRGGSCRLVPCGGVGRSSTCELAVERMGELQERVDAGWPAARTRAGRSPTGSCRRSRRARPARARGRGAARRPARRSGRRASRPGRRRGGYRSRSIATLDGMTSLVLRELLHRSHAMYSRSAIDVKSAAGSSSRKVLSPEPSTT